MVNVVFTGAAQTRDGKRVIRADLAAFAQTRGFYMQRAVDAKTDILVASRADTVKARSAFGRGLRVMTYDDFIDGLGSAVPKTGAKPNPWVDGPAKAQSPSGFSLALELLGDAQ